MNSNSYYWAGNTWDGYFLGYGVDCNYNSHVGNTFVDYHDSNYADLVIAVDDLARHLSSRSRSN